LVFTADEEAGARHGAHFLAETGAVTADAIVIGEPGGLESDYDALHLVSRGSARFRLISKGRQGHSSLSDVGGVDPAERNAGVTAAKAVCAVASRVSLDVPPDVHRLLGWRATVNTGLAFHGGVGFGVLPGEVRVDTEVRVLPGMDRDDVLSAIRAAAATVRLGADTAVTVEFDDPPLDWLPGAIVTPDAPVAIAARDACAAVFGAAPPYAVFPGTTDAAWFAGHGGIPTLPALGPGLLQRAHAADEWVSVSAVETAVLLYAELVQRFCATSPGPEEGGRS